MTAFTSRWLGWKPTITTDRRDSALAGECSEAVHAKSETPIHRTDKTDKSPSVSFVSASPEDPQPDRRVAEHRATPDAAGLPDNWIAGLARLTNMTPPAGIPPDRWTTLIADAGSFLEKWGAQGARLGWRADELFGVHVARPLARFDVMGLVMLLNGRPVVELDGENAVIECPTGSRLTYRRKPPSAVAAKRCLLWELV